MQKRRNSKPRGGSSAPMQDVTAATQSTNNVSGVPAARGGKRTTNSKAPPRNSSSKSVSQARAVEATIDVDAEEDNTCMTAPSTIVVESVLPVDDDDDELLSGPSSPLATCPHQVSSSTQPLSTAPTPTTQPPPSRTPLYDAFTSVLLGYTTSPQQAHRRPSNTPMSSTPSSSSAPHQPTHIEVQSGAAEKKTIEDESIAEQVRSALRNNQAVVYHSRISVYIAGHMKRCANANDTLWCAIYDLVLSTMQAHLLVTEERWPRIEEEGCTEDISGDASPPNRIMSHADSATPSTMFKGLSVTSPTASSPASPLHVDGSPQRGAQPRDALLATLVGRIEERVRRWLCIWETMTPTPHPSWLHLLDLLSHQVATTILSLEPGKRVDGETAMPPGDIKVLMQSLRSIAEPLVQLIPYPTAASLAESAHDDEAKWHGTTLKEQARTSEEAACNYAIGLKAALKFTHTTFVDRAGSARAPYSAALAQRTGMSIPILTPTDIFQSYVARQQQHQQARFTSMTIGNILVPMFEKVILPRIALRLSAALQTCPNLLNTHVGHHIAALQGDVERGTSTPQSPSPATTTPAELWKSYIVSSLPELSTIYDKSAETSNFPPCHTLHLAIQRLLNERDVMSHPTVRLTRSPPPARPPAARRLYPDDSSTDDVMTTFHSYMFHVSMETPTHTFPNINNYGPSSVYESESSWEPRRYTCLEGPTKPWLASCFSHNDLRAGMECSILSALDGEDVFIPSLESLLRKEATLLGLPAVAEALSAVNQEGVPTSTRASFHVDPTVANKENVPPLLTDEKLLKAKLGVVDMSESSSAVSHHHTTALLPPCAAGAAMHLAGYTFEENDRWPCIARDPSCVSTMLGGSSSGTLSSTDAVPDSFALLSDFYATSPIQLLTATNIPAAPSTPRGRGRPRHVGPYLTCSNYTAATFLPASYDTAAAASYASSVTSPHRSSSPTSPATPSLPRVANQMIAATPLQTEVKSFMRTTLMDWFVDVGVRYNFNPDTVFIASAIFDRFMGALLSAISHSSAAVESGSQESDIFVAVSSVAPPVPKVPVPASLIRRYTSRANQLPYDLQLIGAAAIYIASKTEEIYPPTAADISYITADAFSKDQILVMEQHILSTMGFDVVNPTLPVFTQAFHYLRQKHQRQQGPPPPPASSGDSQHQNDAEDDDNDACNASTSASVVVAEEVDEELPRRPFNSIRPHNDTFERTHLACPLPNYSFQGIVDVMTPKTANAAGRHHHRTAILPACFAPGGKLGPEPEVVTHLEQSISSYLSHLVMSYGPYGCGVPVSTMSAAINHMARLWAAEVFYSRDISDFSSDATSLYDQFRKNASTTAKNRPTAPTPASPSSSGARSSQQPVGRRRILRESSPQQGTTPNRPQKQPMSATKEQSMCIVEEMEAMGYLPQGTVSWSPDRDEVRPSALLDACAIVLSYIAEERAHTAEAVAVASEVFEACYCIEQAESATSIVRTVGGFIDTIFHDMFTTLVNPTRNEDGSTSVLRHDESAYLGLAIAKAREDAMDYLSTGPLGGLYDGSARLATARNYGPTYEHMKKAKDNVMAVVTEEVGNRLQGSTIRLAVFNKFLSRRLDSVSLLPVPECIIVFRTAASWVQ